MRNPQVISRHRTFRVSSKAATSVLLSCGLLALAAGCSSSSDSTPVPGPDLLTSDDAPSSTSDAGLDSEIAVEPVASDVTAPVSGAVSELEGRWEACLSPEELDTSLKEVWKFEGDRFENCNLAYDEPDCAGSLALSESLSCARLT